VLDPKDHDFAFETSTGALCKTWQWQHIPKQPIDDIPVCFMIDHFPPGAKIIPWDQVK
jgi:hypothetical protein